MQISYSPTFRKRYKKLRKEVKLQAIKKEILFRKNPFEPSLGTHKLHGRMEGLRAFWVNKKYRIIFEFESDSMIKFHTVGTHDIYK
ncbi:MAG: type II toxin-antitoxin system mRNA interferase toxin, RelE/StbE family [Candidatus Yanofskybacteria bacterium]|nr:type II toxin-antitoxin system mRNA interferase toxin, RelE/StbE family [Candidatus Yanofskybacteria bacterium]